MRQTHEPMICGSVACKSHISESLRRDLLTHESLARESMRLDGQQRAAESTDYH